MVWKQLRIGSIGVLIVVALLVVLREREAATTTAAPQNTPAHRYDIEYPEIGYSRAPLSDPIARLQERLDRGELKLTFDDAYGHGYLPALLRALDIDTRSQTLVFSRTSAQVQYIAPQTPRALYFRDDIYISWPPGAPDIEIASMDPKLGPVFYTLAQQEGEVRFQRQMDECLRCHDSYSLTGGGVPRFLVGSGFTNDRGDQVTHEGWILVDDRTPLEFRWGGWYVTGTHPNATHMGNWVIKDPGELRDMDLTRTGNVTDLDTLIDTSRYLTDDSDIVALLVLDHQTETHNQITRANYDTRTLLGEGADEVRAENLAGELAARVGGIAEPLVEQLLMVDEAEISGPIHGTSGFGEAFEAEGPFDSLGRSLRELQLSDRLFRYPLSYLIYSDAFDALPYVTRQYVFDRLRVILSSGDEDPRFSRLSASERDAILEILEDTKPDFLRLSSR